MNFKKFEKLEQNKVKIDPEILSEARFVAQIVGGDFGMKVLIGEPGQGSFCNPEKGIITLDLMSLIKQDDSRFKTLMDEWNNYFVSLPEVRKIFESAKNITDEQSKEQIMKRLDGLEMKERFEKMPDFFPKHFPKIEKKDINMDKLIFLLGHEAGHRAITRGPVQINLREDKIKELQQKIGFFYGNNAVEDPADNNWVKDKFSGIEPSMKKNYDQQTEVENIPMGIEHFDVQQTINVIGSIPRFAWFGAEVIRYWWKNKFSQGLKPEIKEALAKVEKYLPKIFNEIPKANKTESETIAKAQERFTLYYEKVWPELEKLVKLDIDDTAINEMIKQKQEEILDQLEEKYKQELQKRLQQRKLQQQEQQLQQLQKQLQQQMKETQQKMQNASGKQKQQLQKQLQQQQQQMNQNQQQQQQLDQQMKQQQQPAGQPSPEQQQQQQQQKQQLQQQEQQLQQQMKETQQKMQNASGKQKQQLQKQLQQQQQQMNQNQQQQQQLDQQMKQQQQQQAERQKPFLDTLSDELKKRLKKFFDQLSPKEQEELKKMAKEDLEQLEDQLNKQLEGKLNKDKPKSHQQIKDEQTKEDKKPADAEAMTSEKKREKEKEDYEKVKEMIKRNIEKGKTEYERNYTIVKPIIEKLYQKLKKIFEPLECEWEEGYASGQRISLRKVRQAKIRPELKTEIWEKRRSPEKLKYRFVILIDTSGTMEGLRMEETFKGLVVLTEVLNRLNLPNEIIAFSDSFHKFKDFKEKLNKDLRDTLSGIKEYEQGYTHTTEATEYAWEEIKKNKQEGENIFLITMTDGDANGSRANQLPKMIADIEKQKIKQIGIGLGEGSEFVKKVYPASLYLPQVKTGENTGKIKSFDEVIAKLLEQIIRYPEKFTSKNKGSIEHLIK